MSIKVWSNPSAAQLPNPSNGIAMVVHHLNRLLPQLGFEYVGSPEVADLCVMHAGAAHPKVDVAHNHGLMPTAMRDCEDWEWAVNKELIRNLTTAKEITVPSQWVAETIRRDMRVNPNVVYWGIEGSEWTPGTNKGYVLWAKGRAHGVNDPTPMQKLADMAPDRRFISTYGQQTPNVSIIETQPFDKMKVLLREAGVYLATTRETFGIQTLEAMACGVPILGFNWAATPEIVEHLKTGYLVEPDDFKGLLEGLDYCYAHRKRLGEAAREVALSFTWEKVASQMADVYRRALNPHDGPEVSIIIPCHNYGNWVRDAIDSALTQGHVTHEVIVIDDCSTDNSREVIASYEGLVTIVHNEYNMGVSATRNKGASIARGEYLAFLDADDYMSQGWLKATAAAMRDNRRIGIAYTGLMLVSPNGNRPADWPPPVADVQPLLRCLNVVPTCCLIRKEAFDRAGGYRRRFEPTEDGELWTRIVECGYDVISATVKPLFNYRVGHASLSRGKVLPDYRGWHAPTLMGKPPCVAITANERGSFPVRDYDRPVVSVLILHGEGHTAEQLLDTLDMLTSQTFQFWEVWVLGKGPLPNMRSFPFVRVSKDPLKELRAPLVFLLDSGDNIFEAKSVEKALSRWQHTGTIEAEGDLIPLKWLTLVKGVSPSDTRALVFGRFAIASVTKGKKHV